MGYLCRRPKSLAVVWGVLMATEGGGGMEGRKTVDCYLTASLTEDRWLLFIDTSVSRKRSHVRSTGAPSQPQVSGTRTGIQVPHPHNHYIVKLCPAFNFFFFYHPFHVPSTCTTCVMGHQRGNAQGGPLRPLVCFTTNTFCRLWSALSSVDKHRLLLSL